MVQQPIRLKPQGSGAGDPTAEFRFDVGEKEATFYKLHSPKLRALKAVKSPPRW